MCEDLGTNRAEESIGYESRYDSMPVRVRPLVGCLVGGQCFRFKECRVKLGVDSWTMGRREMRFFEGLGFAI